MPLVRLCLTLILLLLTTAPTPAVADTVNILANPGFESGPSGWGQLGAHPNFVLNPAIAHNGSWLVWLGGYNGAFDSIYQDVTIPANATSATLQDWFGVVTSETSTTAVYDVLYAQIYDPAFNPPHLLATLGAVSNLNPTSGWVQSPPLDLLAAGVPKGIPIRVAFVATTDVSNPTNFYLDDISLTVVTPSPPPPSCTYSFTPPSFEIGTNGGGGSVTVTPSPSSCAWTVTNNSPSCITGVSPMSGTGTQTISFAIPGNAGVAPFACSLTIGGQAFGVTLDGCTFSLASASASYGAGGGPGNIDMTASGLGCLWNASSDASWLTLTSATSGSGSNHALSYSVAAYSGGAPRTAHINISGFGGGGQTFTVTQSTVAACTTCTITPTNNFFPYGGAVGGYGQIAVTAASGVAWTAASNASWLSIVAGSSGTGNGTVQFDVAANPSGAQRAGTLTVGGQTFTVTQAGPPPAPTVVQVVEYHNTVVDDYFITADVNEQGIVDHMWGWERTGLNFNAGGTAPVYRFGGNGSLGPASHFYTLWTSEQSWLQTQFVPAAASWSLEAPLPSNGFAIAMYMTQPGFDGSCPAGTVKVFRASHGGSHRFTPVASALQEVLARGWSNENVAFCAPN